MFTPDFRKFHLALISLLTVGCAYCGNCFLLNRLAVWAERRGESYPYYAAEDPIRVLLPSLHAGNGDKRLLILGASNADALHVETFNQRLTQYTTFHGVQSSLTMDDVLLTLNLVERAYGAEALPSAIVLCLTRRIVANVPRHFGKHQQTGPGNNALLVEYINRYSPEFRVVLTEEGTRLEEKGEIDKIVSRARFLIRKQKPRYQAALSALAYKWLKDTSEPRADPPRLPRMEEARRPLMPENLAVAVQYLRTQGLRKGIADWLYVCKSPYYSIYRYKKSWSQETVESSVHEANEWPHLELAWNPNTEPELVSGQAARLLKICERRHIRLFVVLLPENEIITAHARTDYDSRWLELLRNGLGDTPMLDLRHTVKSSEFEDTHHLSYSPSYRTTKTVIDWLQQLIALEK